MRFSSSFGNSQSSIPVGLMPWTFVVWCVDSCAGLMWNSVCGLLLICSHSYVVILM
jgi:hypothetical protein